MSSEKKVKGIIVSSSSINLLNCIENWQGKRGCCRQWGEGGNMHAPKQDSSGLLSAGKVKVALD